MGSEIGGILNDCEVLSFAKISSNLAGSTLGINSISAQA